VKIYSKNHSEIEKLFISWVSLYCDNEVHEELLSAYLSFEMPYRNTGIEERASS